MAEIIKFKDINSQENYKLDEEINVFKKIIANRMLQFKDEEIVDDLIIKREKMFYQILNSLKLTSNKEKIVNYLSSKLTNNSDINDVDCCFVYTIIFKDIKKILQENEYVELLICVLINSEIDTSKYEFYLKVFTNEMFIKEINTLSKNINYKKDVLMSIIDEYEMGYDNIYNICKDNLKEEMPSLKDDYHLFPNILTLKIIYNKLNEQITLLEDIGYTFEYDIHTRLNTILKLDRYSLGEKNKFYNFVRTIDNDVSTLIRKIDYILTVSDICDKNDNVLKEDENYLHMYAINGQYINLSKEK